jgi:hypothetical protein
MSHDSKEMNDGLFAITVVVGIVVAWELMLLVSWMSGWRMLSKISAPVKFDGAIAHGVTAAIGSVTYGSLLTVSVSPYGIACRMPVLLSLWHKPFFLSWKDLTNSRFGNWWFEPVMILEFQIRKTRVRFRIPEWHREAVAAAKLATAGATAPGAAH